MPSPAPVPFAVNPEEAIRYLREKLRIPTAAWTDIRQEMHARAFVVAGAQSDALLADFHEAVTKAIAEGRTLAQFREDFDRIVEAHGWSYHGSPGWRSAVIFNTNLRMAYSAGRWERIQQVKASRPWLRYIAVMDERTRPLHRAWHNTVLPVDHEWWKTHFPPNGWNCRCSVQSLSDRDLIRLGLQPSPEPPPSPLVPKVISGGGRKTTVMVPKGIDPGFAYNPGEAGFGRGAQSLAMEKHGAWTALEAPMPPPQLQPLPADPAPPLKPSGDMRPEDLRLDLVQLLQGAEKIVADPLGGRVLISQALADALIDQGSEGLSTARYLPVLLDLIADPAEIWAGWVLSDASGRAALRIRYVRVIELADGTRIGLAADADGGMLSGLTWFLPDAGDRIPARTGLRIYRRAPSQ